MQTQRQTTDGLMVAGSLEALFRKRRQTWAMLITGNTSIVCKERALIKIPCRGVVLTNNGGCKPRVLMKWDAQWTEHCRPVPRFTPAQLTYVNKEWGVVWGWEHDDSVSLNCSFVFMAVESNSSLLMATLETGRWKWQQCPEGERKVTHL